MAQEVHDTVGAIGNAAGAVNNAVHNVINVGKQIEENINLNFQPEELLPEPQDRPSLDIAALIASANRISVETIYRDQQAELAKYPTSHLKVLLQFHSSYNFWLTLGFGFLYLWTSKVELAKHELQDAQAQP